jgi:hypothetical protein
MTPPKCRASGCHAPAITPNEWCEHHRSELAAWDNALYGASRQSRQPQSLYTEFDWTRRYWEKDEPGAPATGGPGS